MAKQDLKKYIEITPNFHGQLSAREPVLRYPHNPIISSKEVNRVWNDPALQVVTVHNAGVTHYNDETIMLFRSHLRCGISAIGLARSKNGIDNWRVDPAPILLPAKETDSFDAQIDINEQIEMESGGVEDPRINPVDDTFIITYSAYHAEIKNRVRVCMAQTDDFRSFVRLGPMLAVDMRNVVIFPEKIKGRYVALFRPNDNLEGDTGGAFTRMHLGYTPDWKNEPWEIDTQPIMRTGAGPSAFSDKIGPGAPPVKTGHGWLNLFHGVRKTMDGNPYVLGVALHDIDDPGKIALSSIPVLFPCKADCRVGDEDYVHVPNVVFSCGMLRKEDGSLLIYYGGNDTVMNCAATHEDILAYLCLNYGQDPLSGKLLYSL